MNFLAQLVDGKIKHDFVFELQNAADYWDWRDYPITVEYCELEDILNGNVLSLIDADEINTYVPVGTIEFVYAFIDKYIKENGSSFIKPINVPDQLIPFANGFVDIIKITDINRQDIVSKYRDNEKVNIKSETTIKSPYNKSYYIYELLDEKKIPNGIYQIRQYIDDIQSEWRIFIYKDEIKAICNYSGDCTLFPDMNKIYEMLDNYKYLYGDAPVAFTLDVGVNGTCNTFVIECHDFYSCGLYGFSDYSVYCHMLYRTFNNIKKKILTQYKIL